MCILHILLETNISRDSTGGFGTDTSIGAAQAAVEQSRPGIAEAAVEQTRKGAAHTGTPGARAECCKHICPEET